MIEIIAVVVGFILTTVFTVIGFFIVRSMNHVDASMGKMTESVTTLNVQMGEVVTEMKYQRRDIDIQGNEIKDLKRHVFGATI